MYKYNWELKGHKKVIKSLESDILNNNLSHAYLFSGPKGIGKHSLVKKMSFILQCPNGFCGECSICKEIEKSIHSDTIEISDDFESLKIESIRDVINKLNLTKTSNHKILILENIERLTLPSANALLKTLEDPPDGVMFLFTTTNVKDILPTVISRVRQVNLFPLNDNEIRELLVDRFPFADEKTLEKVVFYSNGIVSDAINMMENPDLIEKMKKYYSEVSDLLDKNDLLYWLEYIESITSKVKEEKNNFVVFDFLDALEHELRKRITSDFELYDLSITQRYVNLIQKIFELRGLLKFNVNLRMSLDNLILNL